MTNLNERQIEAIDSVKKYFEEHPFFENAVIGISGGKDSSVVASLLVNAIGPERVIGVIMPNDEMPDIVDARGLAFTLGIKCMEVDIGEANYDIMSNIRLGLQKCGLYTVFTCDSNKKCKKVMTNLPPRLRMSVLYAVAAYVNGCVVGTSNRSERYLGWGTLWGDTVCDFNPIQSLYCDEVVSLGKYLGLPKKLYEKCPSDGLTGKTDEENFGFTYDDVKKVSESNGSPDCGVDETVFGKIVEMHEKNRFKTEMIHIPGPV